MARKNGNILRQNGFPRQYWNAFPKAATLQEGFLKKAEPLKLRLRGPKGSGRLSKTATILTPSEFLAQLRMLPELVASNALSLVSMTALRAQKVFQTSFEKKRFWSEGSNPWTGNSRFTVKKRKFKGTWPGRGGLMMETGDLYDSIQVKKKGKKGETVFTDPKAFRHHKDNHGRTRRFCYAGLHNSGYGTYGSWGGKTIQRQFMGHSTYIADFIRTTVDRYMFYNVFK